MSGKKSKLARKLAKIQEQDSVRRMVGVIDRQPALTADLFVPYLLSKFSGKAGYKYASVGGYGSLFLGDGQADIVPVTLHREFPEVNVRKRFNDPDRRDIVVNVVHVYPGFRGFVVDKSANVYIGGLKVPATREEINALLGNGYGDLSQASYNWVTAEEFNEALKIEKPLLEKQLQDLEEKVKTNVANIDRYTYLRNIVDGLYKGNKLTEEQFKAFEERCHELFVADGYVIDNEKRKLVKNDGTDVDEREFLKTAAQVMETVCKEFNIEFKLPAFETEETLDGEPVQSETPEEQPQEDNEKLPPPPEEVIVEPSETQPDGGESASATPNT